MIEHAILAGLAGWRLSSMLNWEPGPFDVFGRVRRAAGVRAGELTAELAKMIVCPWCLTVWTSAAMYALGAAVSWTLPAVVAAMAVAMLAERWARPSA